MQIIEITALSQPQLADLNNLMHELSPDRPVCEDLIVAAVECPATRVFAVVDGGDSCGGSGESTNCVASKNTFGDSSENTVGDASESNDAVAGGSTCEAAGGGRIVGCASLCVFDSPTGRKGHIEDVVVSSACRGRHLGRKLLEYILDYARTNLAPIDIHLTSRPSRIAANTLYRTLGFEQRDTNVYRLIIK